MRHKIIWQDDTNLNIYDSNESVLVKNGASVYEEVLWNLMRLWAYSVNSNLNTPTLQDNFIYTLMANATGKTPNVVDEIAENIDNSASLRTIIIIQKENAYVSEIELIENSMTAISGSMLSEVSWANMKNMLAPGLNSDAQEKAVFAFIENALNVDLEDIRYREVINERDV